MAPDEDCPPSPKNQPAAKILQHRARRPRNRDGLLKGCEREFRPQQPLARYCREACREQVRQWRAWKTGQRYRQSANGKQKRQAQSRHYRKRRKDKPERKTAPASNARVIPTKNILGSCDRPGCYAEFPRTRRSPLQRFCSPACRHAVERVLERERRWRQRHLAAKRTGPCGDKTVPISSGHIAITAAVSITSTGTQGEEEGARSRPGGRHFVLSSSEKKARSGTGISPTRTSLRATEGRPPGTRAAAAGLSGRSGSAGSRYGSGRTT